MSRRIDVDDLIDARAVADLLGLAQVERFHRILLEEWAYIRPWRSETQRTDAYAGFIHFYNHHRAHGALRWATPISIIEDNLPEEHN